MADKLALPDLFDAVVARFATEGPWLVTPDPLAVPPVVGKPVPNLFGWRTPAQQHEAPSRILWVPGDNGNAGAVEPARHPGRNPRPLHTLRELCTVYVVGYDATAPEDERKQYEATRLLYDAWLRAVFLHAHGTYRVVSTTWETSKLERRFGAALRAVFALDAMVPDTAQATAPADAFAEITNEIDPENDGIVVDPEVFSTEEIP